MPGDAITGRSTHESLTSPLLEAPAFRMPPVSDSMMRSTRNTLLLRAAALAILGLTALAPSSTAQCLIESGGPAVPGVGADYGSYIASDGDRVVVGQGTWFDRRTATVFERGPLGWSPVATLDGGPVTSAGGAPVAISGDTVMIGNLDDSGERGAVHVYQEIGGVFQQVQVLRAATPLAQAHFGRRLVLKGDRAVIAAPMETSTEFRSGAVYVFERSGGTWTQSARLEATTPERLAFFGLGLDLDDDRIVVGQPGLISSATSTAFPAHVFHHVAGSWTTEQTFPPGRLGFGYSVAIEGDRLAIGSYGELTPGEARGAVLVHGLEPSGWVLRDTITNATLPEEARAEALGQRVDLEGERLLIGTSSPEVLSGGNTALVLDLFRGGHEVVAQVDAPVPASRFSAGIALAGDDLWVGAPGEGQPTTGCCQTVGARHVYRIDAQLSAFCEPPQANSTGRRGDLKVSGCASLADNDLVLLASSLPAGATTLFALGDATSVTPGVFGGAGTLCVSGTVGRYAATTSDTSGQALLAIDLLQLPSPTGSTSAMVGDVGHVQALYRDGASSNSTNALSFTVR